MGVWIHVRVRMLECLRLRVYVCVSVYVRMCVRVVSCVTDLGGMRACVHTPGSVSGAYGSQEDVYHVSIILGI